MNKGTWIELIICGAITKYGNLDSLNNGIYALTLSRLEVPNQGVDTGEGVPSLPLVSGSCNCPPFLPPSLTQSS